MIFKLKSLFPGILKAEIKAHLDHDQIFLKVCQMVLTQADIKCVVENSLISGAGVGLLVRGGKIGRGEVVALYPGAYYPPPPLWSLSSSDGNSVQSLTNIRHSSGRNEYLIHCQGVGGYIDGNIPFIKEQPFAMAQFINHPPSNSRANVMSFPFLWVDAMFVHNSSVTKITRNMTSHDFSKVNRVGSGPWFVDPLSGDTVYLSPETNTAPCAGIAFLATRDIDEGEEILFDYKFDINDPNLPSWYCPVVP